MQDHIVVIFSDWFMDYMNRTEQPDLDYVVTSTDREGNPKTNPHAVAGNAMDFTLRLRGDYAPIEKYNELFADFLSNWPFRAGLDNTHGNIHVHVDLGETRPDGQEMPFFFKEDNGRYQFQITEADQIQQEG